MQLVTHKSWLQTSQASSPPFSYCIRPMLIFSRWTGRQDLRFTREKKTKSDDRSDLYLMEKPARSKGNIFSSFLPKATSVTFHNPPISPGRDMRPENWNRLKANAGKGFSGPVISIIPAEARRKSRSGNFDAEEPTSPKVSCMGQIKHKHKQKKLKNKNQKKLISKPNTLSEPRDFCKLESSPREEKKKPSSAILRIFGNRRKSDNPDVFEDLDTEAPVQVQGRAPSLGHMKRFASGRDSLANFDWSAQIPVASDDQNYHGDGGVTGGEGGKMA